MKMTTPKAILISALLLVLAILFRPGGISYIDSARADVAGMSYYELKLDYDFKRAVRSIIEDEVMSIIEDDVESIVEDCDVTGYVNNNRLYSGDISC